MDSTLIAARLFHAIYSQGSAHTHTPHFFTKRPQKIRKLFAQPGSTRSTCTIAFAKRGCRKQSQHFHQPL